MKKFKNEKLNQLRDLIKINAELRKYKRLTRKLEHDKGYDIKLHSILQYLQSNKLKQIDIRLYYIAYGILRGKQYLQIENHCKNENELSEWDWKKITDIIDAHTQEEKNEKDVCVSA